LLAGMEMRRPPAGGCLVLPLSVSGSFRTTERRETWMESVPAGVIGAGTPSDGPTAESAAGCRRNGSWREVTVGASS
jgi:hypothetical protein